MANVEYETPGGRTGGSRRCCFPNIPDACSALLSCLCGCELSWKDILRLIPCVVWVAVGVLSSVLHILIALCNDKFPETIPIFWGWLSALPAFMCAVLIVMYHREALNEKGFTKDAAISVGLLYGFLTTLGILIYLTFTIASLYFVFRCAPVVPAVQNTLNHCKTGNYGYNAFCFFMVIVWLVIQSYLTPRPRHVQELILKYEHAQAGLSLAAVTRPHRSHGRPPVGAGADTGGVAAQQQQTNNVHPTIYGNPVMYETATVYAGQPTPFTGAATYARTVSSSEVGGGGPQKG